MEKPIQEVVIYTNGECDPTSAAGGFGVLYTCTKGEQVFRRELSGIVLDTTINRINLEAAIQALQGLKSPCRVVIVSQSKYLVDNWYKLNDWLMHDWNKASGGKAANQDVWLRLLEAAKPYSVRFRWVSFSSGNPEIRWVHRLAKQSLTAYLEAIKCDMDIDSYEWQVTSHMRSIARE